MSSKHGPTEITGELDEIVQALLAAHTPAPDDLNPGPHIVYRSARDLDGSRMHALIDIEALDDSRERTLCRALLQYALTLLDASEPERTTKEHDA
ncbi:hypothetical protein [Streptomyces atriruber]|uniref:hypothetical protein n=1 Tax=Streptomyces atriruber TaxID=545121 RepID=UPI0014289A94|nr:hypothetical protein [Streptomyces atriruber]